MQEFITQYQTAKNKLQFLPNFYSEGLYAPSRFFIKIFINSLFPFKKLIFVGTFPFFGYALVTGISHTLYPSWDARTDK